jgi:oligopeptide transport system substrate-binding protein
VLPLIEQVGLLVVAVFRPHKEHGSWLLRETAVQRYSEQHLDLLLDPLTPSDSETLVGNLLRVGGVSEEAVASSVEALRERILDRAEGNPFYVEEVIRSLIDSGAIAHDEASGHWTAAREVASIPIPDTLHGVLMARIDRLQEDTRRVLQMASVIGRIFLYRVLAAIMATETVAREERRLDQQLFTLQREELIRERARLPELEYIFKHELTREAAYNGLLKRERRIFHRQVAEALERLFPDRVEEQLGLLARHWERARDAQKAIGYLLRAGDAARLVYSHEEAIDYYQRALNLLKEQGEHERAARTLMKLGLTYQTGFQFRRSREAYEEGFVLWQRAGKTQPHVLLPPAPHAFRVDWPNPLTLDPTIAGDSFSVGVIGQLFSGLMEGSPEMDVTPGVARNWHVSQGGREYVFHLRDDVHWSDGAPVTARDLEYAWKRVLDPVTGSANASLLYDVKGARAFHRGEVSDADQVGVQALDEVTLAVELEEPTGHFLQLLVSPGTYPVPRHVVEAHGEAWTETGNIVTNGPFRLEAWEQDESMILTRNPEYHGRFGGNVQRVELTLLAFDQWSTGLALYEADSSDALDVSGFPVAERDRLQQRHAGEYISLPHLATYYVRLDVSRPPFDDVRVRQAFVLATDTERLADEVMRGYFPATGGLVPPGMPGHSPGIGLPYDPEQARRLLAEAGYPNGSGFPVVHGLGTVGFVEPMAQYLEAQWQENLGVNSTWEAGEWGVGLFDRLRKDSPHMFQLAWGADYPDPDNFLRVCLQQHQTAWRNEAYDLVVEDARRITDQEERMKLYRQADRMLVEEAPVLILLYGRSHLLVKPWVRLRISATSRELWKDVVIEPH